MRVAHLVPRFDPFTCEPMLLGLLSYRGADFDEQWVVTPDLAPVAAAVEAAGGRLVLETDPRRAAGQAAAADLVHVHCPVDGSGPGLLELVRPINRPFLFSLSTPLGSPTPLPGLCVCSSPVAYRAQAPLSACELIEPGIDLPRFVPSPDRSRAGRRVVARIGDPMQGAEYFWTAMADLLARHADVELQIVGGRGTGTRRVRCFDPRTEMVAALAETTLVVLAPQPEVGGGEYGLLAAMAMGVPAVVADVDWLRACVVPEETALLVPVGDVAMLTGAVERLLADEALRRRLGQRAREQAVQRSDVRETVRRFEAIYFRVLEEGPKRVEEAKSPSLWRRIWPGLRPAGRSVGSPARRLP